MSGSATPEQDYFLRIEEAFIRLRGAPFLLSPGDWRLAQGWYEQGLPVELVVAALEEVFARRRDRGVEGKVQSLSYCADAVESAWRERLELGVASAEATDGAEASVDIEARLDNLAAALPPELRHRSDWQRRVLSTLAEPAETERRLASLDRDLIEAVLAQMAEETRRELADEVEASLAAVRERLSAEVLVEDRRRLLHDAVRRRAALPLLSLFSASATGD